LEAIKDLINQEENLVKIKNHLEERRNLEGLKNHLEAIRNLVVVKASIKALNPSVQKMAARDLIKVEEALTKAKKGRNIDKNILSDIAHTI